ncbi:RidA family protein [Microvirga sp. BT689]|uniref:RidA family protein n=1 Tax=Microvirga arvi TaxID=2778731 RepID=UPI001950513F|nr:RidA family protein [Microvirga arvi]MBM6581188.1 RidA family protein [Microvirga arvi]
MIERLETKTRMSQVVVHRDTVYLAGQVPDDPAAGINEQTRQVLKKIERLLTLGGSDKTKLLSATVWLTDMRYFAEFNEVWDAWIPEGDAPARACVNALLAQPGFKIEIGIVAAR